jgi:hypothetical protein
MAKVMAILPDEEVAETVTSQLSKLNIDDLDWHLVRPGDDDERLFPVLGWPLGGGSGATNTAGGGLLGAAVLTDYPDDEEMREEGADDDEAEFYGQSIEHGGIAIVIDAPADSVNQVRTILEKADAEQVTTQ